MSIQKIIWAGYAMTLLFLMAMGSSVIRLSNEKGESAKTLNTVMDWAVAPIKDLNVVGLKVMALDPDSKPKVAVSSLEGWMKFVDNYDKTLRLTSDPPSVALLKGAKRADILEKETEILEELPGLIKSVLETYKNGETPEVQDLSRLRSLSGNYMAINADFSFIFSKDAITTLTNKGDQTVGLFGALAVLIGALQLGLLLVIRNRLFKPLQTIVNNLEKIAQGDLTVKT